MVSPLARQLLGEAGKFGAERRIEIECSDEAAESLMPLLRELQRMGSVGSSRSIKIEDWNGRSDFDFDGDGASKISTLKLDGKEWNGKGDE